MSIPSYFQGSSLSILAQDPLYLSTRTYSKRLTESINSYSHETRRIGGYWSATIRIDDRPGNIEDWLENGLGRHIETFSPYLATIWAGFVNQVTANLGGTLYQVGPLMRIGNRVSVTYSIADHTLTPPVLGARITTGSANNLTSQTIYGIIERRIGINAATEVQATQIRDLFVNDPQRAFPQKSRDSSLDAGGGPSLTLDCLGYWHWAGAYYYSSGIGGNRNLSRVINDVLGADPNGILSSDLDEDFNTFQVPAGYEGNETADVILKRLISFGDSNDNPYSGGFYEDQKIRYNAVPSSIDYQLRLRDNVGVANKLGGLEKPWDILPGHWIFDPYFLIGRKVPGTLEELGLDPRAVLIETINYDAPWGLSINGVKLSQLDEVMARRGLGGIA